MVTPVTISLVIDAVLGLSGIVLPGTIKEAIGGIAGTMGPLAMIMTGYIIAKYNAAEILNNYKIYIASAVRLILIPVITVFVMKGFGINETTVTLRPGYKKRSKYGTYFRCPCNYYHTGIVWIVYIKIGCLKSSAF